LLRRWMSVDLQDPFPRKLQAKIYCLSTCNASIGGVENKVADDQSLLLGDSKSLLNSRIDGTSEACNDSVESMFSTTNTKIESIATLPLKPCLR
jgi:hypothetical protein